MEVTQTSNHLCLCYIYDTCGYNVLVSIHENGQIVYHIVIRIERQELHRMDVGHLHSRDITITT